MKTKEPVINTQGEICHAICVSFVNWSRGSAGNNPQAATASVLPTITQQPKDATSRENIDPLLPRPTGTMPCAVTWTVLYKMRSSSTPYPHQCNYDYIHHYIYIHVSLSDIHYDARTKVQTSTWLNVSICVISVYFVDKTHSCCLLRDWYLAST